MARGQPRLLQDAEAPVGVPPELVGRTCGQCRHLECWHYAQRYYKCRLALQGVPIPRAIPGDTRAHRRLSTPACSLFEPRPEGEEIPIRYPM